MCWESLKLLNVDTLYAVLYMLIKTYSQHPSGVDGIYPADLPVLENTQQPTVIDK